MSALEHIFHLYTALWAGVRGAISPHRLEFFKQYPVKKYFLYIKKYSKNDIDLILDRGTGILASYDPKSGDLKLGYYGTTENKRGGGVGTELISNVILYVNPAMIKIVTGEFAKTNLQVYDESVSRGLSPEDAAKATPLGRSLRRLGYDNFRVQVYKDSSKVIPSTYFTFFLQHDTAHHSGNANGL